MNRKKRRKLARFGWGATLVSAVLLYGSAHAGLPQNDNQESSTAARRNIRTALKFATGTSPDSALSILPGAIATLRSAGDSAGTLHALNTMAHALLRLQRFAAADSVLENAEPLAHELLQTDFVTASATLNLLAYSAIAQDIPARALHFSGQALALREKRLGPRDPNTASARYTHALVLNWLGNREQALEQFDLTIRDQKAAFGEESPALTPAVMMRGFILSELGRHDECEKVLSRLLDRMRANGQEGSIDASQCLMRIGMARARKGDFAGAMNSLREGLNVSLRIYGPDHPALASFYSLMAELLVQIGDHTGAREYAETAIRLADAAGDRFPSGTSTIIRVLSSVCLRLGEIETAQELAARDIALKHRLLGPQHPDMAASLENAGDVHAMAGERSEALRLYALARENVVSQKGARGNNATAQLWGKTADILQTAGLLAGADSALDQAFADVSPAGQPMPVLEAFLHRLRGDVTLARHDPRSALTCFDRAIGALCPPDLKTDPLAGTGTLPPPGAAIQPREYLTLLTRRANTLRELDNRDPSAGYLKEAAATLARACDVIDDIRRMHSRETSRLIFTEEVASVYEQGVEVSIALGRRTGDRHHLDQALRFAERGKARSLLERMVESRARVAHTLPAPLVHRQDSLRKEMTLCDMELARSEANGSGGTADSSSLLKRRIALRREIEELSFMLRRESPAYAKLLATGAPVSPDELHSIVDSRTMVVEYLLGSSAMYIFTVGPEGTAVVSEPLPAGLTARVNAFTSAIRTLNRRQYTEQAVRLYRTLIGPVVSNIRGADRLIIVPDGILYTLPFEALLTSPARSSQGYTDLPYFIHTHEIRYAYSTASIREIQRRGSPGPALTFAGFAPVFDDTDSPAQVPPVFADVRSVTLDGKTYRALKHSADEVRTLAGAFAERGRKSAAFLNDSASETAFKKSSGGFRVLHVATHGVLNDENPDLSALLFSPGSPGGDHDDGVLYAAECYGLHIDAELVVLSSCESGLGKLVKGEGVLALTRGFLSAGARNVMVSLWKVFDSETRGLMVHFYTRILEGDPHAAALRATKLAMIADPGTAAPAKWGAFILVGR